MSENISFELLRTANLSRAERWHDGGLERWSVADWGVAMAGEAGEALNAIKKLRRILDKIANLSEPDRQISSVSEAYLKIAEEVADTVIYGDLLLQRIGLRLEDAIIVKFNQTSIRYNMPERL